MPDGYASARRSRGRGPADHRSKSRKDALHTLQIKKKNSHWNLSTESKICQRTVITVGTATTPSSLSL